MLLLHVRGAVSFSDMRCSADGLEAHTYRDAAIARSLVETDAEFDAALHEAAEY